MTNDERRILRNTVIAVFLIIAGLITAINSYTSVNAGHVAVLTQFGATTGTELQSGFHLKLPFFQDTVDFDTHIQLDTTESVEAASADLQTVTTKVAVNFHPDPSRITEIYKSIGPDYKARVVDPAILESVKAVTAKYTASQLITERALVKGQIDSVLSTRVAQFNVIIDTVSITNFQFSEAFNTAIEAKQVAQQAVLTAQQHLDRARIDAQQQVVTAQAQAEAQVLTAKANAESQALQVKTLTPLYLSYQAILRWNGILPQYSSVPIPFLNTNSP